MRSLWFLLAGIILLSPLAILPLVCSQPMEHIQAFELLDDIEAQPGYKIYAGTVVKGVSRGESVTLRLPISIYPENRRPAKNDSDDIHHVEVRSVEKTVPARMVRLVDGRTGQ